jgi:hypothetical protein
MDQDIYKSTYKTESWRQEGYIIVNNNKTVESVTLVSRCL